MGEPVQDRGQRRGLFQGHPLGRHSARRPCADRRQGGRPRFGLQMSDIDGLATYPELPATGHAEVDGISIVSVNCMMAMLKLPGSQLAHPGRHDQHRRRRAAGGQRAPRRGVQIRRRVAGDAQPARHLPEPARRHGGRRDAVHRALRLWRSGAGHGGRLHPLARAQQPEPREDGNARGDPAQTRPAQPARLVLRHAPQPRGLPGLADGGLSVLPLRLRHPGAGRGRHRADDGRPGARPEAAARPTSPATASASTSRSPAASAACRATWRAAAARRN